MRLPSTACAFLILIAGLTLASDIIADSTDSAADDPITGIWEGRKLDGRYQTTEPWGPFLIERGADGSLAATFLGSRLGQRDQPMYDVSLEGDRFHLKMNRWGGAVLDARFDPEKGLTGTLRHHGMVEDLHLERIPNRSPQDIEALHAAGKIAQAPPYQSEWMSVLIHRGPDTARRIFEAVRAAHPDRQLWGPSAVNSYGYELINRDDTARAVEVLKLNVLAYPDDANTFDSLGRRLPAQRRSRAGDRGVAQGTDTAPQARCQGQLDQALARARHRRLPRRLLTLRREAVSSRIRPCSWPHLPPLHRRI